MLLLVWLAWALADTAWLLISGSSRLVPPDESLVRLEQAGGDAGRAEPALTANRIEQWQLFGPTEEKVPVSVANAPETRLRLELLGVFQHPSDELASAIIAEKGKDSELYHIGDRLPGNATLEQVLADRVILLRAGQRETLRMKEEELAAGEVTRAEPPPVLAEPQEAESSSLVPEAPEQYRELMQKRAQAIQELNLELADGAGYRVGGSPAARMVGLREGDVIISINGFDLGTEEADLAALASYEENGRRLTALIKRDGQTFTFSYPP